jgi:hypothetical protein
MGMKHYKKILLCLIALAFTIHLTTPALVSAASGKCGVIIGDKYNNYKLYHNLVVLSPAKNIMVKAYNISKELGLSYSYDRNKNKLTIKNPNNGKYLEFIKGSKNYTYYSSGASKGVTKTAVYKFYYDDFNKCYVIHMATLNNILNYKYYRDTSNTYYSNMGYGNLISYSINGYSKTDIPITEELLNYINAKSFTSKIDLLNAIRINMVARVTEVSFKTSRSVMKDVNMNILDAVLEIDDTTTSKDADYLSLLIDSLKQNWSVSYKTVRYSNGTVKTIESPDDPATLTIQVQYETTLPQEQAVDSKVASIIKSLNLSKATDYEKVKAIHDYIINQASYDMTYQRSTAYDILINKTAVCEGYALAAYRLLTDAGLETRIITGDGDGERHAWNIVKVNGQWYNIDLTWDDPVSTSGKQVLRYTYFLKNERDFKLHNSDAEFKTREFSSNYPIAELSYVME